MKSVLLVRLSAMGDLVQSLGAVASLQAAEPACRVTFVAQSTWAGLLERLPGVDRVVTFDRRGGLRALLAVRRELRREAYDCALDLQGNWKSALISRLSGAPRRYGMESSWRQEPSSRILLTDVVRSAATPHPARAAWEIVRRVAPGAPYALPRLSPTEAELAAEREALRRAGIDPLRRFRVIVGTDPRDPRALRPHWMRQLWRAPQSVLLTGPAEPDLGRGVDAPLLHHGFDEVRRLVALGAALAAVDGEVIGPDQGPSHVLLAAGARGRVLFGDCDPRRTAPPTAIALRAPVRADGGPPESASSGEPETRRSGAMDFGPDEGRIVDLGLPSPGDVGDL
ncbi:MAG: hypothetical protein CMJ88_03220 [Planctomycetes bacterium]|nr:hypothetical protein [Planctomycetota bacterium]